MSRPRKVTPQFIGLGGHVVAINPHTGDELWRSKLKGKDFTSVVLHPEGILAGTGGELFCLDPLTGAIRWHNKLPGLGYGIVSFAGAPDSPAAGAMAAASAAVVATSIMVASTAAT